MEARESAPDQAGAARRLVWPLRADLTVRAPTLTVMTVGHAPTGSPHDSLEFLLAAKADTIDALVLAELTRRALVPEIIAADPGRARRAGAGPVPLATGPPSDGSAIDGGAHRHRTDINVARAHSPSFDVGRDSDPCTARPCVPRTGSGVDETWPEAFGKPQGAHDGDTDEPGWTRKRMREGPP
jgi:hypothetical protein